MTIRVWPVGRDLEIDGPVGPACCRKEGWGWCLTLSWKPLVVRLEMLEDDVRKGRR